MEKLGKPLESILFVSWCAPDDRCNIQISQQCKLQGHVGTAIQALGFGLDRAASRPRRCAPRSGFARSSPHPRAGLLIYALSLKRSLSLPARTSECLWEHSRCLSSACIVVGAVTVTPARILSPLSPSPLLLRVSIEKKKSVSPHDSQYIQANVRQPFQVPLDSAFDRSENEQQSTVGEVSQPLKVMAR